MSASDLLRQGGEWLGVARSWLQWHTRNGSRVAWGSNTALEPPLTVRQVEELAAYVAASVYDALTAERAAHERTRNVASKALREIAIWSQELQDRMEAMPDGCLRQWRGCIAIAEQALAALDAGADAGGGE